MSYWLSDLLPLVATYEKAPVTLSEAPYSLALYDFASMASFSARGRVGLEQFWFGLFFGSGALVGLTPSVTWKSLPKRAVQATKRQYETGETIRSEEEL